MTIVWQIFWCQLFLGLNSISLCNMPCNITCYLHTISCIFQKPQRALSTVGRYSHSCMCDMNEKAFAQKSFLRTDMCAWYKTFTRFAFAFQPKGMFEYWNFKIFYHHRKIWHIYHFFDEWKCRFSYFTKDCSHNGLKITTKKKFTIRIIKTNNCR